MSTGIAVKPAEQRLEREALDESFADDGVPAPLERADERKQDDRVLILDSFEELADELEESTAGLSSTRRAVKEPAFVEILALGKVVLPSVVERLRSSENRPLWLRVLGTFTAEPPGLGQRTIDEAADAWIAWGRHNF